MKRSKLTRIFAEAIAESVQQNDMENKEISNSISNNVMNKVNNSSIDFEDAEKAKYYLNRAIEEVSNNIEDANFELNNMLGSNKAELTDIRYPEDGGAVLFVRKTFDVDTGEDLANVRPTFDKFTLRPELAALASYKLELPSISSPTITMIITVKIPQSVVEDLGGSNFDKRNSVISKYARELIKGL